MDTTTLPALFRALEAGLWAALLWIVHQHYFVFLYGERIAARCSVEYPGPSNKNETVFPAH